MTSVTINIWTILVAAVASMMVGMAWYSQLIFGKPWMRLIGMTAEQMKGAKGVWKSYLATFIGRIIMGAVLAILIGSLGVFTIKHSLLVGFVLWLGFVATTGMSEYFFSVTPKSWALYFLNTGQELVSIFVMTIILTLWR